MSNYWEDLLNMRTPDDRALIKPECETTTFTLMSRKSKEYERFKETYLVKKFFHTCQHLLFKISPLERDSL